MIPAIVLSKVLPVLALVGLALTGVENVPAAAAHSPARRHSHQHLAARAALEEKVGAQEKKRYVIRKRADGTHCRVKGGALIPSSSVTSYSPTSPASSAAPSTTQQGAVLIEVKVPDAPAPSPATPTQNNQNWAAPSSAAAPAPAPPAPSSAAPSDAPAPVQPVYAALSGGAWGGSVNVHSKLGHAWPNGNWAGNGQPDYIGNYIGSKASWYYTWSPHSVVSGDALGLEYVPMLWGPHQVGDWHSLQASWPKTVKNALFFNEPNEHSQCNMAAGDSIAYWMNDFLPLRSKGVRLGGAATTSAPNGLTWTQDFERLCVQYGNSQADCKPDFTPLHWYDVSVKGFQEYVTGYYQGLGSNRPLWITEYSCQNFNGGAQCSDSQTWALHQSMTEWFDQQDYIERYSPFGAMKEMQGVNQFNALMNPDGSISSLGNWYIWNS